MKKTTKKQPARERANQRRHSKNVLDRTNPGIYAADVRRAMVRLGREQSPSQYSPDMLRQLQRCQGNYFVQRALKQPKALSIPARTPVLQRDNGSVAEELEEVAGVPTRGHELSVSGHLEAGQTLSSDAENTIHTGESGTGIDVSVSAAGIYIDFRPPLIITHHVDYFFDPDIQLNSLHWNFDRQEWGVSWTARRFVNLIGDPGGMILSRITRLADENLPARMFERGYDPFADEYLIGDLQSFIGGFSGGSSGGLPTISRTHVEAEATLGGDIEHDLGWGRVVIPEGTQVRLRANVQGEIPEEMADLRLDSIIVSLQNRGGSEANLDLRVLDQNFPMINVTRATLRYGGAIEAQYSLVTEWFEALGRLIALQSAREGHPELLEALGGTTEVQQPRMHALVDAAIQQHAEPLIRDLILANRTLIPGVDLVTMIGIQ